MACKLKCSCGVAWPMRIHRKAVRARLLVPCKAIGGPNPPPLLVAVVAWPSVPQWLPRPPQTPQWVGRGGGCQHTSFVVRRRRRRRAIRTTRASTRRESRRRPEGLVHDYRQGMCEPLGLRTLSQGTRSPAVPAFLWGLPGVRALQDACCLLALPSRRLCCYCGYVKFRGLGERAQGTSEEPLRHL